MLSDPELPFLEVYRSKEGSNDGNSLEAKESEDKAGSADEEEDNEDDEESKEKQPKRGRGSGMAPKSDLMQLPRDQVLYRRLAFDVKSALESIASDVPRTERDAFFEEPEDVSAFTTDLDLGGKLEGPTNLPDLAKKSSASARKRAYLDVSVPRDADGKVHLPFTVANVTVLALGHVDLRDAYHSHAYIYPIGYKSEREYYSTVNVTTRVKYTCEILENGSSPLFRVTPSDDPDNPVRFFPGMVHANAPGRRKQRIHVLEDHC